MFYLQYRPIPDISLLMKTSRGRPKASTKPDHRSFGPLGDLIRKHRLDLQLGLADVAKACDCSVQFISNIEHGRAPLPWNKAPKLGKALGISVAEIQAANLAIRADFRVLTVGKKVPKPSFLKNIASTLTTAAQDTSLQEVIQRYQSASKASRKEFLKTAMGLLES